MTNFEKDAETLNNYDEIRQEVLDDYDNMDRYSDGTEDGYNEEWLKEDIVEALGFVEENCSLKDPNETILIARCLNLKDIKDFDKDYMGNSWTTPKQFYSFASSNLSSKNLYCVTGKTKAENIDWVRTVLLYIYNDYEYELYVMNDTPDSIWDIRLWKVVDRKMVEIQESDLS